MGAISTVRAGAPGARGASLQGLASTSVRLSRKPSSRMRPSKSPSSRAIASVAARVPSKPIAARGAHIMPSGHSHMRNFGSG